ncbi:uncharacterized protein LOC102808216, partial [Saccoglossus kowalevskii]|uniref:Uncharacterized protein LOC102808216 n=1 Tax=Saccoglossus kowalevskii TaxID=10224 RepID=A0ABM0M8C3_SACKO
MIAAGISQRNMKELEIRTENDGVLPTQLTQSSVMDAQNYDFNFQRGPLAESGSQKAVYGPLISSFHPALTLLGTQRHIIVGLQNGDVLRCDMETLKDSISTHKVIHDTIPSETPNLIGQDISAELFRGHKGQLIYIGFINNNGQMITVDNKGYIFTWRYHKRNLSHFGWFEPNKKYRLDLSEKTYIPTSNVAPKIYFQEPPPSQTGKSKKSKKTTEDPAVEAERAQAEQMIQRQRLDSQSPWHQDYDPQTQNM